VAARTIDRRQGTRLAAVAAAAVAAFVGLVVFALVWGASGGLGTIIAGPEDVRVADDPEDEGAEEAPHLRVALMAPRALVPGHTQSVTVAVSSGDGAPLDRDASLVLSAALRAPADEESGVVLVGRSTWSTTVGELYREPIRVLALGDLACGERAAELLVRVRAAGDGPPVDATRTLHGPPCDGPEVVAAPASVNLDVPVRHGPNWREIVDRLLDPTTPAPTTRRSPPRRAAPAPSSTPTQEPTEEPSEEPEPEPTETEEPEPEPKPEPKPEPSEPKPTPEPEPSPPPSEPAPEPPPEEPETDGDG
jgi:hypothetical protein